MLLIENYKSKNFGRKGVSVNKLKSIVLIAIAGLLLSAGAVAQTQSEMNQNTCKQYEKADAEMNDIYKRVLSEYEKDRAFIEKLKQAQRAWVTFRDAHLESLYPAKDKPVAYGSVNPMCRCMALTDLTKQRTEMLRKWLTGGEEGDVCAGSIKVKR